MVVKPKFSVNCEHKNITKCDYCFLKILRKQLTQKDENNYKLHKNEPITTQFHPILDYLGLLILTSEGQIKFMTQRGKTLLNQYFHPDACNNLPNPLHHWFKHQIALLTSNNKITSLDFPLQVEQAGKQLLVHFISDRISPHYLLLLQEQELQSFSIASLELLGLTPREAEVLFWVAQDKSNAAIAKVLGCSQGTVRKHLEHIHRKLNVQTRTAAVMVALERLGLLKGGIVAMSS
jgi:DNA-binding CsgD family transcriptional regulator